MRKTKQQVPEHPVPPAQQETPAPKPDKPLTPLEAAQLADPRPIDKKLAKIPDAVDQDNDKLGIRYRNGKWFDLASGQETRKRKPSAVPLQ